MPRKEKTYHFIYKTTCLVTNRFYIGIHSTNNLEDGYLGSGKRLWYSINKYGKENHIREILEFCLDRKSLSKRESELVNQELLHDNYCMNLALGGQGGILNDEHLIKLKQSNIDTIPVKDANGNKFRISKFDERWINGEVDFIRKGISFSDSHIKIISDRAKTLHKTKSIGFYKNHTQETREQMSLSRKGKGSGNTNSQYGTCWITNGIQNKKIRKGDLIPEGWELGRKTK